MTDARHALLAGIVDYAGLFPPASLGMPEVVANYASYRASSDAWMLGRLVAPVARLQEFVAALDREAARSTEGVPWLLAALGGGDVGRDVGAIRSFNDRHGARAVVDVLECKAADAPAIASIGAAVGGAHLTTYVELAAEPDPAPLVAALREHGLRAKIRTGGVTPEAFPPAAQVARFLARCVAAQVPCKATAGLHHPVRGDFALTYAGDAPRGTMFGFLNVFVAAGVLVRGGSAADAEQVLGDSDPHDFSIEGDVVRWRDQAFSLADLGRLRHAATAFGSCSFREPVDDLAALAPN